MTDFYCASTGDSTSPSTGWDEARSSIVTCVATDANAGDNIFLDSAYVHGTSAAITVGSSNSYLADPVVIISTDRTGDPEPPTSGDYLAGAKINVTSASNTLSLAGGLVFIGCTIECDGYMAIRSQSYLRFEKCAINLTNSSAERFMNCIEGTAYAEFIECDFTFSHASHHIAVRAGARLKFKDCTLNASSAAITRFFKGSGAAGGWNIDIDGFDFSSAAVGFELLDDQSTTSNSLESSLRAYGLVVPSSGVIGPTPSVFGIEYDAHAVDSEFAVQRVDRTGNIDGDTTTVLTSTYDGLNKYSHEMVSTAQARLGVLPIYLSVGYRYHTANPTITVELTSDSTLTDQEFWLEVLYPESGNTGMFKRATTRNADFFFGSGATLTTSAESWTSGKTNTYKIDLVVSGGAAGVHRVFAALAPGSVKTVYVDGAPVFS